MIGFLGFEDTKFKTPKFQPRRSNGNAQSWFFCPTSLSSFPRSGFSIPCARPSVWVQMFLFHHGQRLLIRLPFSLSWRILGTTGSIVPSTGAHSINTSTKFITHMQRPSVLLPSTLPLSRLWPLVLAPSVCQCCGVWPPKIFIFSLSIFGSFVDCSKPLMPILATSFRGVCTTSFLSGPAPNTTMFITKGSLAITQALSGGGITSSIPRPARRLPRRDVRGSWPRKLLKLERFSRLVASAVCCRDGVAGSHNITSLILFFVFMVTTIRDWLHPRGSR